ncbi:MAG: PAS domain S-box protein [Nitrospirota bacterium]
MKRIHILTKKENRLFLLGMFVFLVFISGILVTAFKYMKLNRDGMLHELEDQVKVGSDEVRFYFDSLRSDLLRIERYLANSNMKVDKELYRYLDFIRGIYPNDIPAILVLDSNGNMIVNTNPDLVHADFRKSEYFESIQQTPTEVFFSEVFILSDLSGQHKDGFEDFDDPLNMGFVLCSGVYSKGILKGYVLFVLRAEPLFNRYSKTIIRPVSGCGFILQENDRILYHREVELRGKFLSDLPASSELRRLDYLVEKTKKETLGRYMVITSEISLENQRWTIGILTTTSWITQKTLTPIYILSGVALFLGAIIFGLVFSLMRLDRARRELRESEERYRTLYSTTNEGIALHEIIYDKSGAPLDYRILDVNPAFESILGIKKEDAVGAIASELYRTSESPYLDIYAKVAASGEDTTFETTFDPLAKSFKISVFSPAKGKFATLFSDITDRKKSEEELMRHREHLESLVKERTVELEAKNAELQRLNRLFVGRELRMAELKEKLRTLEDKIRNVD